MQELNMIEVSEVSGAGNVKDIVDDIKNADFIGAYESLVAFTSHVIERVLN